MEVFNSSNRYGWISILLHWLMAIAFIGMFGLGLFMVDLDYYDPWYHRAPDLHRSIGVLLVMLMLLRFLWNHFQIVPISEHRYSRNARIARLAHRVFYLLVLSLFISGYLISTAKGKGIDVFGWFDIPPLLSEDSERGDSAGDIHEILAWSFILLAAGHALAALYHHFYLKDSTLRRMLGITQPNQGETS